MKNLHINLGLVELLAGSVALYALYCLPFLMK